MRYSKHAPEWLVGFHKDHGHTKQGASKFGIYDAYIAGKLVDWKNDASMKLVWEEINSKMDDRTIAGVWFLNECVSAYTWPLDERKTRGDKRGELLAISKKAVKLAELIGGKKRNLWARRAAWNAVSSIVDEHNFNSKRSQGEDLVSALTRFADNLNGRNQGEERHSEEGHVQYNGPSLVSILTKLSDNLIAEAEIPPATAQVNVPGDDAHRLVFIKRLTDAMLNEFGDPLKKVVVNTVCVIFDIGDVSAKDADVEKIVYDNTRNQIDTFYRVYHGVTKQAK